jgi:protoheme IX farnesyltransferase
MLKKNFLKDLLALTKPNISLMALLLAIAGFLHAPSVQQPILLLPALACMIAIYLLVGGANSLNMYCEYQKDALMVRTKNRPIPAQRLKPLWGLVLGLSLCLISSLILLFCANTYTFLLSLIALVLYVLVYTPLKQKTWISLFIGSIPGAMPVMLGYMSKSGVMDQKVIALFLWAFLWQIPHFLAISIFREAEYTKAGFIVAPKVFGINISKFLVLITSWLLVISTITLYLTDIICIGSLFISLGLGGWFLYISHKNFFNKDYNAWAKKTFKASLIYQSILFFLLLGESFISY